MPEAQILVVEDNEMQSKLVSFLLLEGGYTVKTASSAEQAIELLRSFQPQLILMDLQLPGMDGLELTRRLRFDSAHSDTVIVALTAYTEPSDLQRAREAGCDGHISKPIDTGTFAQFVRRFTRGAQHHVPADSRDLLAEMRNSFLAEGLEQCAIILKDLQSGPGCALDAIQRVVHRWVALGGTMGFPEIADYARKVSTLLARPSAIDEVERGLETAKRLFSHATHKRTKLPPDLVTGLQGVRIGLVGLSQDEVERMRSLAKRVDMQVVLEILEGSWLDKQRDYHALVVSACASSGPVIALGPELQVPVVLITSRSSLQSLSTLPAGAFDFLIAPWDAEEIFLRVNRLVAGPRAPLGSPDHSSQRRPRVLVVDDDPSMTALISNALRRLPIYCDTARSGQEALSSVRQSPPDAMVLDVNLLDLNGFEVLKRVRQSSATKDLPVLLLTGRCQESDIAQGFGCGADDYVMKPFKPFDLANRVEQMIAARGRSDARPAR